MTKFSRRKNLGVGLKSKILRISRRFSFAVSNEIFCSRKNFFHLLFSLTDSPLPKYFGSYYQDTDARIGHVGQSRTCFLSSFSSIWTSCRFLVLQGLTTLLTENVRNMNLRTVVEIIPVIYYSGTLKHPFQILLA